MCSKTAWKRINRAIHYLITTTSTILSIWQWNRKQYQRSNNIIMSIIKIKEAAPSQNQILHPTSWHKSNTSHCTKQIKEKKSNSITGCRITEQTYPSQTTTVQTKTLTLATAITTLPTTKSLFLMWCKRRPSWSLLQKLKPKTL